MLDSVKNDMLPKLVGSTPRKKVVSFSAFVMFWIFSDQYQGTHNSGFFLIEGIQYPLTNLINRLAAVFSSF